MVFIRGQNTPYFSWGFDPGPVKLPGLSRNRLLIRRSETNFIFPCILYILDTSFGIALVNNMGLRQNTTLTNVTMQTIKRFNE